LLLLCHNASISHNDMTTSSGSSAAICGWWRRVGKGQVAEVEWMYMRTSMALLIFRMVRMGFN
jgi:hypothetical protein